MTEGLTDLLADFEQRYGSNPSRADRTLLMRGRWLLQQRLQDQTPLDAPTIQIGRAMLHLLAEQDLILALLSHYLTQPLSISHEAWARWHSTDALAIARRCEEAVSSQRQFLHWARDVFPRTPPALGRDFPFDPVVGTAEPMLSVDSLFLWLMGDATQAECWKEMGRGDEWLGLFHEVLHATPATPDNRFRRFNFLRSGVDMSRWLGRFAEALFLADRIGAIGDEEVDWQEGTRWRVEGNLAELRVHVETGDARSVRQSGEDLTALISEFERRLAPLNDAHMKRLRGFCHNAALPLRGAGQYDLAIPLLERAVALGMRSPWTYLSLAAALWATTQNRERVLELLREAASLFPVQDMWSDKSRPAEFDGVADDPEFRAAATPPVSR